MLKRGSSHLNDVATKRLSKYMKVTEHHTVAFDDPKQSSTSRIGQGGLKRSSRGRGRHDRDTAKSDAKTSTRYHVKAVHSGRSDANTRTFCGKSKVNTVNPASNSADKRLALSRDRKESRTLKGASEQTGHIRHSKRTPCGADKRRITDYVLTHTYNLRGSRRRSCKAYKPVSSVTVRKESIKRKKSHLPERKYDSAKQKTRTAATATCTGKQKPRTGVTAAFTSKQKPRTAATATCTGKQKPRTGVTATCTGKQKPRTAATATCTGKQKPRTAATATCTAKQKPRTAATATCTGKREPQTVLETASAAKKVRHFKIKTTDDYLSCWITGIAVTRDGQILLVDRNNRNVKMFSKSMELQSVLILKDSAWGITIIDDNVAVVARQNTRQLLLLDFSEKALKIIRKQKLSFTVYYMCKYKDKLIAVTQESTMDVKMIDLSGKVYWSVTIHEGVLYTICLATQCNTVIATDQKHQALIVIDGDTGRITRKVQLTGMNPQGVTCDQNGNIYVCCSEICSINLQTDNLINEKVILTKREMLRDHPQAIAFDSSSQCLFVTYKTDLYDTGDFVDIFKLL